MQYTVEAKAVDSSMLIELLERPYSPASKCDSKLHKEGCQKGTLTMQTTTIGSKLAKFQFHDVLANGVEPHFGGRGEMGKTGELSFGEFRLDPANALLRCGHDRVALPPKPFEVLCCLAKQAGRLVTKGGLLDTVWPNIHVTESSLSVSINALRVALGDDAKAPHYIETVMRRGYRFIAPVSDAPREEGLGKV